ncbi:MAG: nuclear transport factor 2 family protein [Pseudarthrobacter sp.]
MTSPTPIDVATAYFDALSRGEVSAAMALLKPEAIWYQPGDNRFSGTHHGIDAIGALLGGMMEASQGTFVIAVNRTMMANGPIVAVPVQFSGTRTGASMDMPGMDLLTVEDGSITEVRLFSSNPHIEDTFWG